MVDLRMCIMKKVVSSNQQYRTPTCYAHRFGDCLYPNVNHFRSPRKRNADSRMHSWTARLPEKPKGANGPRCFAPYDQKMMN